MKKLLPLLLLTLAALGGSSARLLAQPTAFAKGADVGWLTQMEAAGRQFYNTSGVQQDLLQILHDYDLNTIRLRVWVNPAGGWNGKNDVVAKAIRARNLGFRILIDFHYSDTWADPGHQTKPAAWQNLTFPQLKTALYNHTYDVLDSLKDNNVVPEWVQVGNETPDGMLWPDGRISTNAQNFAELVDQGYAAVKAVNPTSKVIVHVDNGYNNSRFRFVFDRLAQYNARYDVIGLSLYPSTSNWPTLTAQCLANMNDLVTRYPGKEVMVVETGMPANAPIPTQQMLLDLMSKVRSVPGNKGLGVVYWEPEAYNWQGYSLGAWSNNGQPTAAMDAFRNTPPTSGLVYNPGFEYTAPTQSPLGWTTLSLTGDQDADFTQNYGRASNYQLTHDKAAAYQVRTYQLLSNLPNGTYTMRAWATSTGGQTVCELYAKDYGGVELTTAVPATAGNWVQLQVPGIVVSNGQCEIGLRSVSPAGASVGLDDVEFIPAVASASASSAGPQSLAVQVYPNPATSTFRVAYALPKAEKVSVELLNLTGQRVVSVLAEQMQAQGPHSSIVNLEENLPSGVYFLKILHGSQPVFFRIVKL